MASFAEEFFASAPADWKKTAWRPEDPSRTVEGLFRFQPQDVDFGYAREASDASHRFEVPLAQARAFDLRVGTVLVFEETGRFRVVSAPEDERGWMSCLLRRYAT